MRNLMNYLNSKKENIKNGAKKAVATGLVFSILLGGAAMMTACDSKYQNESETLKSVANQVEKCYKQMAKEIYSNYKEEFSDLIVYKDLQDKSMIILAGEKAVWNASYEISGDEYDKLFALAIASGNEKVEASDNRIYVDRETLNDASLNHFVEELLDNIKGKETSQYQYLDVPDGLYNETHHLANEGEYEYYDSPNDEIINNIKNYREIYNQYLSEWKTILDEYQTIDIDEIRFGKIETKFWNVGDSYENPTGIRYSYNMHIIDNVDTNGDGIDDTKRYLNYGIVPMGEGMWSISDEKAVEAFEKLAQALEVYDGDENIRHDEDGMWYINPDIIGDGKYAVFNDVFRIVLYDSYLKATHSSYADDPNTYVTFIYEEPIQQEQSMEQ